jgi:hypothetical protein
MSTMRLGYRELGLNIVSLEESCSHTPKLPFMAEEKRDNRKRYNFKLLLEEALMRQRNRRQLATKDAPSTNNHFGGATPFKVQVNINTHLFEGHIDVDALEKWLNMIEGYFSVHNFSNSENITFVLLKALPHVRYWWDTYCEKHDGDESIIFGVGPTLETFVDALKEQYYPVRIYDDKYTRWTTLLQERCQMVPKFINTFYTLQTKIGIKESKKHLLLKYHGDLHMYIQTEMDFFDISSLGVSY